VLWKVGLNDRKKWNGCSRQNLASQYVLLFNIRNKRPEFLSADVVITNSFHQKFNGYFAHRSTVRQLVFKQLTHKITLRGARSFLFRHKLCDVLTNVCQQHRRHVRICAPKREQGWIVLINERVVALGVNLHQNVDAVTTAHFHICRQTWHFRESKTRVLLPRGRYSNGGHCRICLTNANAQTVAGVPFVSLHMLQKNL